VICAVAGAGCGGERETQIPKDGPPSLVVRVTDTSGTALEGVPVQVTGRDLDLRLKTDAQGLAEADLLPPGSYTVAVLEETSQQPLKAPAERGGKYETLLKTVAVAADGTARAAFRVPALSSLLVEVNTRGLDAPVDGAFFTLSRKVGNVGWVNLATAPQAHRLEWGGGRAKYQFDAIPTGTYRVRLNPRDRVLSLCEVKVLRNELATCRLGPCLPGLSKSFAYEGAIPRESKVGPYVRLQLSRWDHPDVDVAHTYFSESARTRTVRGLRAGRYVALVRPAHLARLVDIGERDSPVRIEPPAAGVASGGDRTLTVEVHAGGNPLHRLLVCGGRDENTLVRTTPDQGTRELPNLGGCDGSTHPVSFRL